jgi:hypothetical protein
VEKSPDFAPIVPPRSLFTSLNCKLGFQHADDSALSAHDLHIVWAVNSAPEASDMRASVMKNKELDVRVSLELKTCGGD